MTILYSNLIYKIGQYFLDTQYMNTHGLVTEWIVPSPTSNTIELISTTDNLSSSTVSNESTEATTFTPFPYVADNESYSVNLYDNCTDIMDVQYSSSGESERSAQQMELDLLSSETSQDSFVANDDYSENTYVNTFENSNPYSSPECTEKSGIANCTQLLYPLSCYTSQEPRVPNDDYSENPYVSHEEAYNTPCHEYDTSDSRSIWGSSKFRNELEGSYTKGFEFLSCKTVQDHDREESGNDSTRYWVS